MVIISFHLNDRKKRSGSKSGAIFMAEKNKGDEM
jgi:hypothetical protein